MPKSATLSIVDLDGVEHLVSGAVAAQEAGISYRVLHYWVALEAIEPQVRAHGSGNRHLFSPTQVHKIKVIELINQKVNAVAASSLRLEAVRSLWTFLDDEPNPTSVKIGDLTIDLR